MSHLISSSSSTLQSHLSSAMATCNKQSSPSGTGPPAHPLSLLHSIWESSLPTQTVQLATIIMLESSLSKASQEMASGNSKWPLDDLAREIHSSLKVLSVLLQGGRLDMGVAEEKKLGSSAPSDSAGGESSNHLKESTAHARGLDGSDSSNSSVVSNSHTGFSQKGDPKLRQLSPHQITRLQRIAFILYGYKQKVNRLRQLIESLPNLDLLKSPSWDSMLHFEWSAKEQTCLLSAVGVATVNECNFSEGVRPFLCLPEGEKSLQSMLQAVDCGINPLLIGCTVICSTYVPSYFCACDKHCTLRTLVG